MLSSQVSGLMKMVIPYNYSELERESFAGRGAVMECDAKGMEGGSGLGVSSELRVQNGPFGQTDYRKRVRGARTPDIFPTREIGSESLPLFWAASLRYFTS